MVKGRLGFNENNGRYGLLVSDLWEVDGLHCGDLLDVLIDDKWITTRIEMTSDQQWYLVDTPYMGNLEYIIARLPESN